MKIPEPKHINKTERAIYEWYKANAKGVRGHLGASEIGKECTRAIWYSFRWATEKNFEGRILRLFNTGVREESRILEELRGIGCEVVDKDENGKQISFGEGHFSGSCDAIVRGLPEAPKTWAIVEMKTHGVKSFTELQKVGVEKSKPEHFAQMQMYMGWAELDRALYFAVCKDTDAIHTEWLHFDDEVFESLKAKAQSVINHTIPPEKLSTDPAWFKCKFCDHQDICHNGKIPKKNCRTCAHSTPLDTGEWHCGLFDRPLNHGDQAAGCRSHLFIPPLVGESEDMGADWVKYKTKNGIEFVNAAEDSKDAHDVAVYSSQELQDLIPTILENEAINETKKMGAKMRETVIK